MRKVFSYGVIALMAMVSVLTSCNPDGPGNDEPAGPSNGSVVLSAEQGNTAEYTFAATSSWVVSNTNTWFSVTPNSGQPGNNTLTIEAVKANTDIMERVKPFTVIDGAEKKTFYVVQRGVVSTEVPEEVVYAMIGVENVNIPISGTYPFDQITVTSDAEWLQFTEIAAVSDSILLDDDVTYSNYMEGQIKMAITQQNEETSAREATVTLVAGEQTFTFIVMQQSNQPAVADYTKDFFKSSVMIKFTGTWCVNCPMMSEAVHMAQDDMPGRLFLVNAHNGSTNDLDWSGSSRIATHFNLVGLPSGYFNGYAEVLNYTYKDTHKNLVDLLDEAIDVYPTNVGINATSKLEGNQIKITVNMAAKVSGNHRLTVFFLEDGIKAAQADGTGLLKDPNNYVHKDILRGSPTNDYADGGQLIVLTENQVTTHEIAVSVPSNIVNVDNMKVLIYVTHEGGPTSQSVTHPGVVYKDFGWVLDNAVLIPVNGFADFKYEN